MAERRATRGGDQLGGAIHWKIEDTKNGCVPVIAASSTKVHDWFASLGVTPPKGLL